MGRRTRGGSPPPGRALLVPTLLVAASWGCSGEAPQPQARVPDAVADPTSATDTTMHVFTRPVIVFATASAEDLDAARSEMADEDYYVMADDLMWYRAAAEDILVGQDVPVERVEGRAGLRFLVDGQARHVGFADIPTLDLVVLYRPDAEPVAVPPIELSVDPGLIARYFAESVDFGAPPGG